MKINSYINSNFKTHKLSSSFEDIEDDLILHSYLVIMDEGKYSGLLTLAGVLKRGFNSVVDSLQDNFRIQHGSSVADAILLMEENRVPVLPVFRSREFAGVITYSDLLKNHGRTAFSLKAPGTGLKNKVPSLLRNPGIIRESEPSEDSLRESRLIFKTAFELHSNLMAITTVNEGIYIDVNKTFCSTLGFKREEIIGRSSVDLKIWTSREARDDILDLFQAQGFVTNQEVKYYAKNGTLRYGLFSLACIEIKRKKYLLTSMADITDQKLTELALRESEELTRRLINIPGEHIILLTPDLTILDINEDMLRSIGKTKEEVIGHNGKEFIPQDILDKRKRVLEAVIESGKAVNHTDQRGRRWLSSVVFPIFDESGEVSKIGVSARDITPQKNIEMELEQHRNHLESILEKRTKELYESEKRYREIINTITDYVYQVIIGDDKRIKTIHNDGCYGVTGYHSSELTEDSNLWVNIIFEQDRETVINFFKGIINDTISEQKIEHRIVHKDGSIRWINNTIIINRNTAGKITGYDGVIKDITEKRRTENEIRRLNQHIIKLQEEERQRVAQDLHDSVGQIILAAKINIEAYLQNPSRFKSQIDTGLLFLTQASNELREIYTGLYPAVLNDLGLETAVRLLISNSVESAGIMSEVDISLDSPLPHDLNVNLYRIVQEIVSNILKHSQATFMSFSMRAGDKEIELTVKDNGKGFNPNKIQDGAAGYGLSNIKSRLEAYNGSIFIEKNLPSGISIHIIIGLNKT